MFPVIRGIFWGFLGYLVGAYLTAIFTSQAAGDPLAVVMGSVAGIMGWLMGVGMWESFGRQWMGLPDATPDPKGWKRYFHFTVDHKVIGIQYLMTLLLVFVVAGGLAMVMRWELMRPGQDIMGALAYNRVMSMHGILMVGVAVATMMGAFGNYLVPIMIGADDMAFPRLNALGFWLLPPAAVAFLAAPILGSFEAGWTAYPPLSTLAGSDGTVLFVVGVFFLGLSSILGALNLLTTVITMRAPGMTWGRLPIFVWSAFGTAILQLLLTQFFAASVVLILLDRVAGTNFFIPEAGGDILLYEHMFWFYSHPAVYIMVIPAIGAVLETITHMVRKPLFAYRTSVFGIMMIVGLSNVVWAHHMFTSGMANWLRGPFLVTTEMISEPTGLIFLAAIGTIWQGKLRFQAPLILSFGWIFNFLIGGITGIYLAAVATDIHLHDTYFVVAHFHHTIMGGGIFGLLVALFFWFPKMTGRMYNQRLAKWFSWLVIILFNTAFIPMYWAGVQGLNRRVADYPDFYAGVNMFSSISSFLLGTVLFLGLVHLAWSTKYGPKVGNNPWGATTLEWQISSPPPAHNFHVLPKIIGHPYNYGNPNEVHADMGEHQQEEVSH
jgi:cytochrome c oxidase subunit 1